MKKICLCCLALICLTSLFAQETVNYLGKDGPQAQRRIL